MFFLHLDGLTTFPGAVKCVTYFQFNLCGQVKGIVVIFSSRPCVPAISLHQDESFNIATLPRFLNPPHSCGPHKVLSASQKHAPLVNESSSTKRSSQTRVYVRCSRLELRGSRNVTKRGRLNFLFVCPTFEFARDSSQGHGHSAHTFLPLSPSPNICHVIITTNERRKIFFLSTIN